MENTNPIDWNDLQQVTALLRSATTVLADVEWAGHSEHVGVNTCSWCGGQDEHCPDCQLEIILKQLQSAPDELGVRPGHPTEGEVSQPETRFPRAPWEQDYEVTIRCEKDIESECNKSIECPDGVEWLDGVELDVALRMPRGDVTRHRGRLRMVGEAEPIPEEEPVSAEEMLTGLRRLTKPRRRELPVLTYGSGPKRVRVTLDGERWEILLDLCVLKVEHEGEYDDDGVPVFELRTHISNLTLKGWTRP